MKLRQIAATLPVLLVLELCAQDPTSGSKAGCDARNPELSISEGFRALRVVEDPGSHRRWLIEQNVARPEGPARVVQIPNELSCGTETNWRNDQVEKRNGQIKSTPLVRAGEVVRIVQESPTVRVDLEAMALSSGGRAETIAARLRMSGKVVIAVVAGPGRAVLPSARNESYR
jgi:hypothetical protein